MLPLYAPRNEIELLILRSILEDAGLHYFVRNETFGSLYMGPHVEAYNRKTICVPDAEADEARALLAEYLRRTGRAGELPDDPEAHAERHASWLLRWIDRLLRRWQRPDPEAGPALRVIRNEEPPAARRRPPQRALRLVHGFRTRAADDGESGPAREAAERPDRGMRGRAPDGAERDPGGGSIR